MQRPDGRTSASGPRVVVEVPEDGPGVLVADGEVVGGPPPPRPLQELSPGGDRVNRPGPAKVPVDRCDRVVAPRHGGRRLTPSVQLVVGDRDLHLRPRVQVDGDDLYPPRAPAIPFPDEADARPDVARSRDATWPAPRERHAIER